MNIEPNASLFNTDGLSFPCFDDNLRNVSGSIARKSKDVIFRSDLPGSKKKTIIQLKDAPSKQMSWDDIYENRRVSMFGNTVKHESSSLFTTDPFLTANEDTDRLCQPMVSKQRITLAGDFTKPRSSDKSRLSQKKRVSGNKSRVVETNMKSSQVDAQAELIVVDWCRSASPPKLKRVTNASSVSEVTSSTSDTSRSGEHNEVSQKVKFAQSNRCVRRSRTVGGTPSRRLNTEKLAMQKPISRERFCNDFDVNWPSADGNAVNREPVHLRQIRDTPSNTNIRYTTPKRAVSTGRRTSMVGPNHAADAEPNRTGRRTSMVGVHYGGEAESTPLRSNARSTAYNHPISTPSKAKSRLYMSVSSPRKNVNMKVASQCLNDVTHSKKFLPKLDATYYNTFDSKKTKNKTTTINSEPIDFSEFDTDDFSMTESLTNDFSMPFKPVEQLFFSSTSSADFFHPDNNNAEEEAWSALFSPPIG